MKTFMLLLVFACFVCSVATKRVYVAAEARTKKKTLAFIKPTAN